jgi:hypothetical protein
VSRKAGSDEQSELEVKSDRAEVMLVFESKAGRKENP